MRENKIDANPIICEVTKRHKLKIQHKSMSARDDVNTIKMPLEITGPDSESSFRSLSGLKLRVVVKVSGVPLLSITYFCYMVWAFRSCLRKNDFKVQIPIPHVIKIHSSTSLDLV